MLSVAVRLTLTGALYQPAEGAWPFTATVVAGAVLSGLPWHEPVPESVKLLSPSLKEFVGLSFQYADYSMRYGHTESGPPSIVSTVKINRTGFTEMMDTEDMFRKWFTEARAQRLLP